jgi:hypothetical protein
MIAATIATQITAIPILCQVLEFTKTVFEVETVLVGASDETLLAGELKVEDWVGEDVVGLVNVAGSSVLVLSLEDKLEVGLVKEAVLVGTSTPGKSPLIMLFSVDVAEILSLECMYVVSIDETDDVRESFAGSSGPNKPPS